MHCKMAFTYCYKSDKIMNWKTVVQIVDKVKDITYKELVDFNDGDLVYLNKDERYVVSNIIYDLETKTKVVVLDLE